MKKKRWISLVTAGVVLITAGWIVAAEYNSPWVKTQALYLNNVLVTATGAELNVTDVTAGTATASKALVLGASKEIATITTLGATAVNAVNIDAGSSGAAGTIDVFPATASKGKLALTCQNQTGNTTVTLDADAMGQATTINFADPGASASYVVQSTAAVSLAEADLLQDLTSVVQSTRHRVTAAELNADHIVLPAVAGKGYRIVDFNIIPYGGNCGALTSLELEGDQSGAVDLISLAQANMTQSNLMTPGATGVTVLADGATFNANTANTALTATVTGSDVTTCTGVDFNISFVLE